jgi:hypothetical protein
VDNSNLEYRGAKPSDQLIAEPEIESKKSVINFYHSTFHEIFHQFSNETKIRPKVVVYRESIKKCLSKSNKDSFSGNVKSSTNSIIGNQVTSQHHLKEQINLVCNSNSNIIVYSNYYGGIFNLFIDVDIIDLKIGVVAYNAVEINLSGPYVSNVVNVDYSG